MNTQFWGPPAWIYLHTLTFNYPIKLKKTKRDKEIKKYYKHLFTNLRYTLPCKYCRRSYVGFLKELPLESHLNTRKGLTRWFYDMHNKVNEKLRNQEQELFEKELKKLKKKKVSKRKFYITRLELADAILLTGPDPTFKEVCRFYESSRAKCSASYGMKVCI